jgi:hypothetical protein
MSKLGIFRNRSVQAKKLNSGEAPEFGSTDSNQRDWLAALVMNSADSTGIERGAAVHEEAILVVAMI